jgi:carbon storage regulator
MLVLSRRRNQKILIDTQQGRITLTVVEIRGGDLTKIGIDAPQEMPVHRSEVMQRIEELREAERESND